MAWPSEPSGDSVGPADFRQLSMNARLAAALLISTRWLERVGIHDSELDALVEHLWAWLTVTPDTFDAWYESEPALVLVGLGGELPDRLTANCTAHGIEPERLAALLRGLTEIVYGSLFGAADDEGSLAELGTVAAVVGQHGLALPPSGLFADSPISEGRARMDPARVHRWRHAAW
jgi:hypothetical protein